MSRGQSSSKVRGALQASKVPPRREFKYLVDVAALGALRSSLAGICERDVHSGPDGTYLLRSLYFDTPDMRLFKANENENPVRFKARVRCYPDAERSPVFAEIKGRNGDVVVKTRATVPDEGWPEVVRGADSDRWGSPALSRFVNALHRWDLRPVVLVQYRREAWVSRIDDYARVSIDRRIECQVSRDFDLRSMGHWRPIDSALPTHTPQSVCVVELKWAETAPRWMVHLVQRLNLLRHSFSKYCHSLTAVSDDHFVGHRGARSPWS